MAPILTGAAARGLLPCVAGLAVQEIERGLWRWAAAHPEWLALNFATGGLTVNGGAAVHAAVLAPTGAVMVNGTLNGSVAADRLTLNGGAVLKAVQ